MKTLALPQGLPSRPSSMIRRCNQVLAELNAQWSLRLSLEWRWDSFKRLWHYKSHPIECLMNWDDYEVKGFGLIKPPWLAKFSEVWIRQMAEDKIRKQSNDQRPNSWSRILVKDCTLLHIPRDRSISQFFYFVN